MVMKCLHVALEVSIKVGLFKGVNIGSTNFNVSNVLYVDDALIFGSWSRLSFYNLVYILNCLYAISGLKINLNKSRLFGVGVDCEEVKEHATFISFRMDKFPFSYLGILFGEKFWCNIWFSGMRFMIQSCGF